MNTIQRIAKNTGVLLVSQVISYLLGFLYIMYAARYLKAEGFGILSFAFALTGILSVFTDLGLRPLTIREVARNKSLASKYLANISVMKVILATITFGLITLIVNLMGSSEKTIRVVYIVALSAILTAFTRMFYSIFQAFEKMGYQSLGQILSGALMLLGAIFAIRVRLDVISFAGTYFMACTVVLGYSLIVFKWKFSKIVFTSVSRVFEMDWGFWKPTIKEAMPFFLAAAFSEAAFRIDMVILSMIKGDIVVGWYSAAYRILEASMLIPAAFVTSMYPLLSNYYVSSQASLRLAYQKSFKYLSILGMPIAVGTTILGDRIILLIYHSDFICSIIALKIVIWTAPIIFLTYMFGTVLASINQQRLILKILLLCLLLNVVMNMVLIPRYSYVGASIATVGTELLSFILCYHFLSKLIYKIPIFKFIVRPAVASIIMGFFVFVAKINFFLLVCLASSIYFSVLIFLKTFSMEEFNLFKQIFVTKQARVKE